MKHFYQAIQCKYCGPTNTKGTRIKVSCAAKTKFISWDYALNPSDNYYQAAKEVAKELGWLDKHSLVGGVTKSGLYVFVLVDKRGA